MHGDPAVLQRVWTNLLDNAIKFTGPKPNAVIEVGARADGGETVFFVKDNGVGFDMQYADKLFGVFQRLHRWRSSRNGHRSGDRQPDRDQARRPGLGRGQGW